MTKIESLAMLSRWADAIRRDDVIRSAGHLVPKSDASAEAESYGLDAVRIIRVLTSGDPLPWPWSWEDAQNSAVVRARRATAAALAAIDSGRNL